MSVTREEVEELIKLARQAPFGTRHINLAQEAVTKAELLQDDDLCFLARLELILASARGGQPDLMYSHLAWCVAKSDSDPQRFNLDLLMNCYLEILPFTGSVLALSVEQDNYLLDDYEKRMIQCGRDVNFIYAIRRDYAQRVGNKEAVQKWQEKIDTEAFKQFFSFCEAPVWRGEARSSFFLGKYEQGRNEIITAFETFNPQCVDPHPYDLMNQLLIPELRLGYIDAARYHHIEGMNVIDISNPGSYHYVADHIEYLARTANFNKAIKLFESYISWAMQTFDDLEKLEFLTASTVLFDRILTDGQKEGEPFREKYINVYLPTTAPGYQEGAREYKVSELYKNIHIEALTLAMRFDDRNGNTYRQSQLIEAVEDRSFDVVDPLPGSNFVRNYIHASSLYEESSIEPNSNSVNGSNELSESEKTIQLLVEKIKEKDKLYKTNQESSDPTSDSDSDSDNSNYLSELYDLVVELKDFSLETIFGSEIDNLKNDEVYYEEAKSVRNFIFTYLTEKLNKLDEALHYIEILKERFWNAQNFIAYIDQFKLYPWFIYRNKKLSKEEREQKCQKLLQEAVEFLEQKLQNIANAPQLIAEIKTYYQYLSVKDNKDRTFEDVKAACLGISDRVIGNRVTWCVRDCFDDSSPQRLQVSKDLIVWALEVAPQMDRFDYLFLRDCLAGIYFQLSDFDKAIEVAQQLIDGYIIDKNWHNAGDICVKVARQFYLYMEREQAIAFYSLAIEYYSKSGSDTDIAKTQLALGQVYLNAENYYDVVFLTKEALGIFKQSEDNHGVMNCSLVLGIGYLFLDQHGDALYHLHQGLKTNELINQGESIKKISSKIDLLVCVIYNYISIKAPNEALSYLEILNHTIATLETMEEESKFAVNQTNLSLAAVLNPVVKIASIIFNEDQTTEQADNKELLIQQNLYEAKRIYEQEKTRLTQLGLSDYFYRIHWRLAMEKLGLFQEVIADFQEYVQEALQENAHDILTHWQLQIAKVHLQQGQLEECNNIIQEIQKLAQDTQDEEIRSMVQGFISYVNNYLSKTQDHQG